MKVPTIFYKAGVTGFLYSNINYALAEAERESYSTGKPVTVYSVVNNQASVHVVVRPKDEFII